MKRVAMTVRQQRYRVVRPLGVAGALLLAACVSHVRPYKPKVRNYKPERYAAAKDRNTDGSLWRPSAETLFTMRRSQRVGDLITVLVSEEATATRGASTDLSRKSEITLGINAFAGAMAALKKAHPSVDPAQLISAATKNDFSGAGKTNRSGTLAATISARIKRVLPNGDLYVEGSKVVMVNEEESHFYISGVVRPADIQADNSVASGLIADVQIEYTGRGPVADKQRPGWFTRLLDMLNPF